NLTDTTNNEGLLQLVGIPTSTQGYQITVSKPGYSTERTYQLGDAANPNPLKPHSTITAGAVTSVSFAIDRLSPLTVYSSDVVCTPVGGRPFSMTGAKLI